MRPGLAVSLAAAALLSGCSLAPRYAPPRTAAVAAFKEEAGDWTPAQPADARASGMWWEVFGDTKLNDLEKQLNAANPDLLAAVARFEQARALARQARSNVFPTLGADASAKRGKSSANAPLSAALGGTPVTENDFVTGLDLEWEVDLFGRLRNTAAAARAEAQSSAADLAAVQLSLQAELASDYFSLRGADATVQLLEDTLKTYDHAIRRGLPRQRMSIRPTRSGRTRARSLRQCASSARSSSTPLPSCSGRSPRCSPSSPVLSAARPRRSMWECPRRCWSADRTWPAQSGRWLPPTRVSV